MVTLCAVCRELGKSLACDRCLGRGVHWNDGVPTTYCPANGTSPLPPGVASEARAQGPFKVACGRRGEKCNGCDRPATEIPSPDDIKTTRAIRANLR